MVLAVRFLVVPADLLTALARPALAALPMVLAVRFLVVLAALLRVFAASLATMLPHLLRVFAPFLVVFSFRLLVVLAAMLGVVSKDLDLAPTVVFDLGLLPDLNGLLDSEGLDQFLPRIELALIQHRDRVVR